jgi:hypothetical protein
MKATDGDTARAADVAGMMGAARGAHIEWIVQTVHVFDISPQLGL